MDKVDVLVIGAGIGGLTTAAFLAQAGRDVRLWEAHIYPGGCAGTFFHQGYRFDAGATLAAGFAPGAIMDQIGQALEIDWQLKPAEEGMQVILPDGSCVTRYPDPDAWRQERIAAFGIEAEPFWAWQEKTAALLWQLTAAQPPWPPQRIEDWRRLAGIGIELFGKAVSIIDWAALGRDGMRTVADHLEGMPLRLRHFVDAQLLIAAQAESKTCNALYGAAALDLSRQGIAQPVGGIGTIAEQLAAAFVRWGGQLVYRQEVAAVSRQDGRFLVTTKRGKQLLADEIIFNMPPWNVRHLLGADAPAKLRRLQSAPEKGWGAFMLYLGVDEIGLPSDFPLHQQLVIREPFGEGNTLFLSLSPKDDVDRAPAGQRTITVSTHTDFRKWRRWRDTDPAGYEVEKAAMTEQILTDIDHYLPGLRAAVKFVLPGTPQTFARFTRRTNGWVGGFPQIDLLQSWGPRLGDRLWLVGDSIFPGQSIPAVALGGERVAKMVLHRQPAATHVKSNSERLLQLAKI